MKLSTVKEIIKGRPYGYRVSFERRTGCILTSDFFPERTEELFKTESTAWNWAKKFAKATGSDIVNIYVIDRNFKPVEGYRNRMFKSTSKEGES